MINLGRYRILTSTITACDREYLLQKIVQAIKAKKMLTVSPLASNTVTLAFFSKELRTALHEFDFLVPDSQWLKWSIIFLYKKRLKERLSGSSLLLDIIDLSAKNKYSVLLYCRSKPVLNGLTKKFLKLHSKLVLQSMVHSDNNADPVKQLVRQVVKSKSTVIFLALGSPQQELFALQLKNALKGQKYSAAIVPVGAAFDFVSGKKMRAPSFMQNLGLEWLHRLYCEPRRLWKRYILLGPLFIGLIVFQKLKLFNGR